MIFRIFAFLACLGLNFPALAQIDDPEGLSLQEVRVGCLNGEPRMCFELGLIHDFGEGLDEDNDKAMLLYLQACDADFVPACLEVAAKHRIGDEAEFSTSIALELYQKSCELNDANGCYFWGNMVHDGEGFDQADPVRAAELYDQACSMDLAFACFDSAMTKLDGADLEANISTEEAKDIFSLFAKGCELGDGDSCYSLSGAYLVGYGTETNQELSDKFNKEAQDLWAIACEEGDTEACEFLEE